MDAKEYLDDKYGDDLDRFPAIINVREGVEKCMEGYHTLRNSEALEFIVKNFPEYGQYDSVTLPIVSIIDIAELYHQSQSPSEPDDQWLTDIMADIEESLLSYGVYEPSERGAGYAASKEAFEDAKEVLKAAIKAMFKSAKE